MPSVQDCLEPLLECALIRGERAFHRPYGLVDCVVVVRGADDEAWGKDPPAKQLLEKERPEPLAALSGAVARGEDEVSSPPT